METACGKHEVTQRSKRTKPELKKLIQIIEDGIKQVEILCTRSFNNVCKKMKSHNRYLQNIRRTTIEFGKIQPPFAKYRTAVISSSASCKQVVPIYLLHPVPPLPRLLSYAPLQKNISIDEHWENALVNANDSRTVAEAGDLTEGEFVSSKNRYFLADEMFKDLVPLCAMVCMSAGEIADVLSATFALKSSTLDGLVNKITQILDANSNICRDIDSSSPVLCTPEQALSSYTTLFCRRCFKYDCMLHRQQQPVPKKRRPVETTCRVACGNRCHLCFQSATFSQKSKIFEGKVLDTTLWHTSDRILLRSMHDLFSDNYCLIAKVLKKPCWQIKESVMHDPYCLSANSATSSKQAPIKKSHIKKSRYPAFTQLSQCRPKIEINCDGINTNLTNYEPCDHEGPCEKYTCRCVQKQTFCEKFCSCGIKCLNRFLGCRCRSKCSNKQCPCFLAIRECDPDLCISCGAGSFQNNGTCTNICIQRTLHKHLYLSESLVAGWGIFVAEAVRKNEFIAEYCGEIVTQEEAEKRGRKYDILGCSFLFNLNDEFVVDATYKGNKIRFANHSIFPNCYAKVMMVNGDHRIGIYASRNILPGEELFFDYRYGPNHRLKFVSFERDAIYF